MQICSLTNCYKPTFKELKLINILDSSNIQMVEDNVGNVHEYRLKLKKSIAGKN